MSLGSRQQIQVLHVDDEPDVADLTATFLERESDRFVVETATSADEGLEMINDCPPDCVVSDYNMPRMDGLEFLQVVRETNPDLPFILFTGKGSEAVASEAIAADVTDYLQKGPGSEQYELLANRIKNAVQGRREAKRADRQEQLMRLTEFAGDTGGFELDPETGEVMMTDGARRILNLPEGANPNFEDNLQYYHPDDRANIQQAIQRACQTGEQTHGTWRYQHPDGEQQLLEVTYTPVTANGDATIIRGAINDITDRQERQQELRLLQRAIDDANVPITLTDPSQSDGPLVYVNDAFEEMTGYPPEETLGRNCRFLQGADTDPEKTAALRTAIDNQESISVELRNYRTDGTEFWNRLTVTPIYDDDGQFVRYLGTQEDVTERKERERELERTRDRMRNMEQLAGTGAWEYDTEAESLVMTDGARRILGLDTDGELTLAEAFDYVHPDDRQCLEDLFADCLDMSEPYESEVRLTIPDEGQRWLTVRGERVNEGEADDAVQGYIQDITEFKQREQEILELKRQYQTLAENLPNGAVFLFDTDLRYIRARGKELERVGISADEIEGSTPHDVFPEETADELARYFTDALDGNSQTFTQTLGDETYRNRTVPVRTGEQEITHGMALSQNVTDQTEQKQRLTRQNERLDEFASVISHDLRSPLTVAAGNLELAQETCESDYLDQAVRAIDRSQSLIDDLLRLAREGDQVNEMEPIALTEVARDSWQSVETRQATLEVDGSQTVRADRSRLRQLFENIYRNSVEHGSTSSRPEGDDATVTVSAMDGGFYVADNGPGIPEADREEVFEAGYSTAEDGTGFGLRIVRQVADAHGWEVTATESESGEARFQVTGVETGEQ
jgi:PAS domain S-box-containing protein